MSNRTEVRMKKKIISHCLLITVFLLAFLSGCNALNKDIVQDDLLKQTTETLFVDKDEGVTNEIEESDDRKINSSNFLTTVQSEVLSTTIETEDFKITDTSQYRENEDQVNSANYILAGIDDDIVLFGEIKTFSGYVYYPDGGPNSVEVSTKVNQVFRGNEAYKMLQNNNPDLKSPEKGMEYIVISFTLSFHNGDMEYISLKENNGTLAATDYYFSLTDDYGSRQPLLGLLDDDMYSLPDLARGESITGSVVFFQEIDADIPLTFVAFNHMARFFVNK